MNIEQLRSDTRGTAVVAHLNNCGASLPPAAVVDALINHVRLEETKGAYEAAAIAGDRATALYRNTAELIGCKETEIAFCDSASRAWNTFVYSLRLKPGDRVLISALEFGSGLIAVQHAAERAGAIVEVLTSDDQGRVVLEELDRSLSGPPPALVAITHAAAHCGSVNPVADIGKLVKNTGALYLVDACQSVGQIEVNVHDIACDALTVTGRKWLRGPRGTGLLFVKEDLATKIDPVTSDLVTADYLNGVDPVTGSHLRIRDDARRFELWERSIAGAIGLGVALRYLLDLHQRSNVYNYIRELAQHAADGLRTIKGVEVWAPATAESGIVGFVLNGVETSTIKSACSDQGVNISTMADWDAPLDFRRRASSSVCRVAAHYFNLREEVDQLISIVRGLAQSAN
jgi:selenocysteine lyase/cysteine desulfurase